MAIDDIKISIEKLQRRLGAAEYIDAILFPRISEVIEIIYKLRSYTLECKVVNKCPALPNNYDTSSTTWIISTR